MLRKWSDIMNTEISKAQIYLKQIEGLRQQELELKQIKTCKNTAG